MYSWLRQVYITGHGGDGFMKFQDKDEATADEIGDAFFNVGLPEHTHA